MKKSLNRKKFSIVLPFYNEEDVAEKVIRSLVLNCRKRGLAIKFVLANNGSTDNTGKIITRLEHEFSEVDSITINKNRGYGFGIRKGLEVCKTAYIGYMWGDGQIKPNDLIKVSKQLQNNPHLDICKAARVRRHDGWLRKKVSDIYNSLIALLFSLKVKDVNGTPKVFKRSYYQKMNLASDDWFLDAELIIKARKLNMSIEEIPVTFYARKRGTSNVSYLTIFEFLKNLLIYRFKGFKYE